MKGLVFAAALIFAACSRPPPDATADGALRAWIEKMEAQVSDPTQARSAYALLGPEARANLAERAERASRAQGRRVEPYEMLAQGRFGLKFRPISMKTTVQGNEATVEVSGDDPEEHATVRCVREGSGFRVEPNLDPLPVLQKRPDR